MGAHATDVTETERASDSPQEPTPIFDVVAKTVLSKLKQAPDTAEQPAAVAS